ncbi:hypothetical protein NHX12_000203 [Muraenolepis orangiensis]|uniref:NTR domain-containing protein n=1 Tax=Muraenolepis orangiensis TaxID=630683 RepID=A0A9Q0D6Y4_9TELE|nr:hypothetical protein NHX12_000203 [Muraenolepis orangiensis]
MMETPLSYSCERRKEYVLDGNDCADAFFKCSETLAKLQAESKTEALYLARRYRTQLMYRKPDGSFSVFPRSKSSSWLTSYTAKVFAMANTLIRIDESIICVAIKWLIQNSQMAHGKFVESGNVFDKRIMSMPGSMAKAVSYLEGRLPSLTDSYAVAITSYALAVANKNKFRRDILFKFASSGLNHWPMANHLFTLEATAYALLALVKVKSTTMVYQALAEYWMDAQDNYDANSMDIDIKIAGHAETTSFRVNRENAMETRYTIYHIVSLYYKRPSSINTLNNCERFNITVVLEPVTQAEGANVYLLKIEILYKNKDTDAGMTIVDISHLTGYMPDLEDLNRLSSGRDKTIQMYLIDTSPSEKVSLIIYLDKVSHTVKDEIAFKIKQTMSVGVLQPAVISIYEYDEQGCSMQTKGPIQNSLRQDKACDAEAQIDYVYQVTMESYQDYKSTDIYKMRINKVIKEGPADIQPNNQLRQFIGYSHCREILNLKEGLSYLIMGTTKDILNTHNK